MKIQTAAISILVTGLMGFTSAQAVDESPRLSKEVLVGVNEVYVPAGFDSKSEAYVVVSGLFNNGCYSWSRADVKHISEFEHEVKVYAKVTSGMCIMVLVPYQKEVKLGTLATGNHLVRFMGGDETYLEKTFEVE